METLGILHAGRIERPRVKSVAALWRFERGSPHVLTDAQIQAIGGERIGVNALWDTGASTCAVSREVAYKIGLAPTGRTECEVAGGGTIEAEAAEVLFTLPDGTAEKTEALIIDMPCRAYNFIVGMNLILRGDFIIRGGRDGFEFRFRMRGTEARKKRP